MKEILIQQQEQQKALMSTNLSNKNNNNNNITNNDNNNSNNNSSRDSLSTGDIAQSQSEGSKTSNPNLSAAVVAATEANEKEFLKTQKLQAELLLVQQQLSQKSRELLEKEESLLFDMRDFKNLQKAEKEKANAKIYLSSIDNLASLKPQNEESISKLREKSRAISAITIKSQLVQGTLYDFVFIFSVNYFDFYEYCFRLILSLIFI